MDTGSGRPPLFSSREDLACWQARRAGRPPRELIHLETTCSTNTRLKELALAGAPAWTALVAERQESGRGRMGRSWLCPARSGLLVSLLLDLPCGPWLTARSALAAAAAVERLANAGIRLKWPNDIVARSSDGQMRKIGGVLVEAAGQRSIVGLGLNVDMLEEEFPLEIRKAAGSILSVLGLRVDRADLLAAYFDEFTARSTEPAELRPEMLARSSTIGGEVAMSPDGTKAVAVDIDDQMRLVLQSSRGRSAVTALSEEGFAAACTQGA